jgi:hypothetical protein
MEMPRHQYGAAGILLVAWDLPRHEKHMYVWCEGRYTPRVCDPVWKIRMFRPLAFQFSYKPQEIIYYFTRKLKQYFIQIRVFYIF